MAKILKITQVRSIIGSQEQKHRSVMRALGFKKNYRTLYKNDTPSIRGMLNKIRHLVVWEVIDEKDKPAPSEKKKSFTVIKAAGKKSTGKGEK